MTVSADYESVSGLRVNPALRHFVEQEVLEAAGLVPTSFWSGLATIIADLAPRHHELVAMRGNLQAQIDEYHRTHRSEAHDAAGYEQFLRDIGYLVLSPAADAYMVATKNVDAEMALVAGPQIVAPLSDASAILDAVNARWGSLLQVLYDGDGALDPHRMKDAIAELHAFLDRAVPLAGASHAEATAYRIESGRLEAILVDGSVRRLTTTGQLAGFIGPRHEPASLLLVNNGLHIELRFDRDHAVGKLNAAGLADVVAESALSAIMDLDDTVNAADTEDKIAAYRNWHELIGGRLGVAGQPRGSQTRNGRAFQTLTGGTLSLNDRPILLTRHVGHHVFTDMVLDAAGNPVPEAIIDAAVTVASALQDIRGAQAGGNSRTGSIYVIKSKMHGPDEVGLADLLFKLIEELVGLPKYTMKIGVMDEERRTSLNLAACMSRVRDRTFLLRTVADERIADEIRTGMEAGPMPRRAEIAEAVWLHAYEANNVDIGIARNLPGRALIGKGTAVHAGASTIGVSTPRAATRQAMHFHGVDVTTAQEGLRLRPRVSANDLLSSPVATHSLTPEETSAELEQNLRDLLAALGPLLEHGAASRTGARATLHAAGRHVANWLHHGVIDTVQVRKTLHALSASALIVKAAESLIFEAAGCLDDILPSYRRQAKARQA